MFKDSFKYYKSKNPGPKLNEVIDIHNEAKNLIKSQQIKPLPIHHLPGSYGLKPSSQWEVYSVADCPGLIYIKNPFVAQGQRYWGMRCLKDFSRKENRRNIDQFNVVADDRQWWDMAQSDKDVMKKLRWATLGYHHNWDTKVYSEENKGVFPSDLSILTKKIAEVLGYFSFNAEAAIVNYYHMDSTLSGHIDHSEQNLEAPLFSFSFGQTAIFLLGGKTMNEKPIALLLKSGDIVVMSKESRLAYHGVPKILKSKEKPWNVTENIDELDTVWEECGIFTNEDQWKPFDEYLKSSRINMNVRQVLHGGQKKLNT